jgi:hypothetical protein
MGPMEEMRLCFIHHSARDELHRSLHFTRAKPCRWAAEGPLAAKPQQTYDDRDMQIQTNKLVIIAQSSCPPTTCQASLSWFSAPSALLSYRVHNPLIPIMGYLTSMRRMNRIKIQK